MDRKTFLKLTAGSTLGLTAYMAACRDENPLDAPEGQRTLPALGFQLYTIRQIMIRDMRTALQEVAAAGYTEVEFAGYFNKTPNQVRALVREFDLDPVSAHVDINELRSNFEGVLEAADTVGHKYVVVPFLAEEERATADDYRRLAEEFNQFGERFRRERITFGYHNHEFEFEPHGQERGMDILLQETDPSLVTFEIDLYWARAAGVNVVDFLQAWPDRFRLCHVKDADMSGRMVDVGDGVIAWERIFPEARAAGLEHFFVENDIPKDPVVTARRSAAYLSELTF